MQRRQAAGESQPESAATTASPEGGECFGGAANAVSHRPVGRGHGLRSLWLCEALYRLLELYEILHAVQASRLPTKAQQVPLP